MLLAALWKKKDEKLYHSTVIMTWTEQGWQNDNTFALFSPE